MNGQPVLKREIFKEFLKLFIFFFQFQTIWFFYICIPAMTDYKIIFWVNLNNRLSSFYLNRKDKVDKCPKSLIQQFKLLGVETWLLGRKTEEGESLNLRPAWFTKQIPWQPRLHRQTLFQKQTNNNHTSNPSKTKQTNQLYVCMCVCVYVCMYVCYSIYVLWK